MRIRVRLLRRKSKKRRLHGLSRLSKSRRSTPSTSTGRAFSQCGALLKVWRDALMRTLDTRHPGYGFADHKGYPVRAHYDALAQLGACPAHRRSFGPVREVLGLPPLPPWPLASERASATSGPEA